MTLGDVYLLAAGMAFLAIWVTGRRLRRLGVPGGKTFLLMAHKLLSLSALALVLSTTYHVGRLSGLAPSDWAAAAVAGAALFAAAATGGVVSGMAKAPRGFRTAHRVASICAIVASAVAIYFLLVQV